MNKQSTGRGVAILRSKFATERSEVFLDAPEPPQMNSLNEQGLGGSRCGSVTVRFKHHTVVFFIAAPPLRYLIVSDSKSKRFACADCLLTN